MSISKERLEEIKNLKDADIDYSDIPELDESFWDDAYLELPEKINTRNGSNANETK